MQFSLAFIQAFQLRMQLNNLEKIGTPLDRVLIWVHRVGNTQLCLVFYVCVLTYLTQRIFVSYMYNVKEILMKYLLNICIIFAKYLYNIWIPYRQENVTIRNVAQSLLQTHLFSCVSSSITLKNLEPLLIECTFGCTGSPLNRGHISSHPD